MPPGRKDQRRKKLKKSLVWVFPSIRVAHHDSSSLLGYKNYEAKHISLGTEAPRCERASVGQIHTGRTDFSRSHLEESQISATGQGARLVPIISQILSRAPGQCSTSTSFWVSYSRVLAEHRDMGSMKVTVPPKAFGAHAEEWLCCF